MRIIVDLIGFLAGLTTLITIFVPPESLKQAVLSIHLDSVQRMTAVPEALWCILLVPVAWGMLYSRKYQGFRRLDFLHLISSIVIWPFWVGFYKGTKLVGYVTIFLVGALYAVDRFRL